MANITDFGAKIGGARKDYYTEIKEQAAKYMKASDINVLKECRTLSALVRLPNLESLAKNGAISADGARAVLTTWRSIDRKPATAWYVGRWAEKTAPKLARIAEILGGADVTEKEKEGAEFKTLAAANWPAEPFSFGAYSVRYSGSGYYSSDCNSGSLRALKGSRYCATESTPEAMAAAVRSLVAQDSARRAEGPALAASRNRAGVLYIHPEHNANICIKEMPAEANVYTVREYIREHRAELCARLHALQQFPALRREWNRPRVGTDWRNDRNMTPEDFTASLPFRGVEFGNWVNQTERANLLNLAFDGFHDLAQLWGISADACTLGGSLAFAFGSRGKAGAMAHYEPLREVINLTKKNGAGCMAHEWFHAVDNWTMTRQGLNGYATEASTAAGSEEQRTGAALLQAIRKTEFFQRSRNLALYRGDYWTSGRELAARGFEGVCAFLMRVAGVCSDFLVNCVSMDDFTAADVEHRSDYYPYPTEAEAATLAPYYFDFLCAVFGDCVQMSDAVRREVESLAKVAESDAKAAEIRRGEDAAKVAQQRAEIEAAAKKHAEALAEGERVRMESRTAEILKECGGDWSYIFRSAGHYYAVGGGRGFVFMVYRTGKAAYRLTRENGRIRKALRSVYGYILEYRRGLNVADAIRHDLHNGFTGVSLMYDVFRNSYTSTWEDFTGQHAKELAEVQRTGQSVRQSAEGNRIAAAKDTTATPKSPRVAPAEDSLQTDEKIEEKATDGKPDGTEDPGSLTAEEYSERATVVRGYDEAQYNELVALGGKYNRRLKGGPGIIFSTKKHGEAVAEYIARKKIAEKANGGRVWQFARGTYFSPDFELHEVREMSGWFELVCNISDSNGGGVSFPDRFSTYEAAAEALARFRPGSRLVTSPENMTGHTA